MPRQGGPVGNFTAAPDVALDIEPPRLDVLVWVIQGAKGFANSALHPISETVVLLASRTGPEDISAPLVEECVKDDLNTVAVVQRAVTTTVSDGERTCLVVVADQAEIERGVGEDHPHRGALRRRLPSSGRVCQNVPVGAAPDHAGSPRAYAPPVGAGWAYRTLDLPASPLPLIDHLPAAP